MDLSVMFFGADDAGSGCAKYADILAIARAADELGFTAVWTPERHFQQVGQVFPNPVVLSAAIATATNRIAVRAGSAVLPLHHPVRVVEDWAVVDNLSGGGRVGLSVATGWHSADFVLAPGHYADRRARALRDVELIRRLWRGEPAELTDGTGATTSVLPQPRPVSDALPIWLTSSGSVDSWVNAGRLRTGVLSSVLGQDRDSLAERISRYRTEYRVAPPVPGTAERGTVTVMAHAYAGADDTQARKLVSAPLKSYFRNHVRQTATNQHGSRGKDLAALTERDVDTMAEFALARYLTWGSLIGSAETCLKTLLELRELGCDEVACFVDFGLDRAEVLASLRRLAALRDEVSG